MDSAAWLPLDLGWPLARVAAVLRAAKPVAVMTAAGDGSGSRPGVPAESPLLPVQLGELQSVSSHCCTVVSDNTVDVCELIGRNTMDEDTLRVAYEYCRQGPDVLERHS
jgi:hypothetical protein